MHKLQNRRVVFILIITAFFIQLSGCSGGGGSGTSGSLIYSGNTNSAVITLDNAPTLVGNVLYGGESGANIPAAITLTEQAITRSAGAVVQADIIHNISHHLRENIYKNNATSPDIIVGVAVNEPLMCEMGSGNLTGTLDNSTGTGTLNFTYRNCLQDGISYNGTGSFIVDHFDFNYFLPTDIRMVFTLMSISSPEFTGSISGTIRIQSLIISNTEKMTMNYVSKDQLTGKMFKFENMLITTVYDQIFWPSTQTQTYTGMPAPARSFDSIHGYVEVDTLTPLVFSSVMLTNPDVDGVMLFMGAAGSSIRVTVLSGEHLRLELDIDGISGYEVARTLLWSELALNTSTDINDTDNDGMHNSWETGHGLDPLDGADADQDVDGDGFSNIEEYQGGTDPNDVSVFPASANLSIAIMGSSEFIAVGEILNYMITLTNAGPDTADDTIVTDTLPTGLSFISASPSQGNCSGSSPVSCNLGSLGNGATATINISVTPGVVSTFSNTVNVSSGVIDPDLSNNSAVETNVIGASVSSIQDQIDVASTGVTIFVAPGTYVGQLNFNGKNITIQSADGAGNTILAASGFNATAVQIGPNGAMLDFTITNANDAAINVSGQGALIKGNIFQGNSGSFGVAIRGNNASAVIEQNIFRNNSCDNQGLSGVVSFINASSPVIVNNVFENNLCRGINLSLPSGPIPVVINNTLVRNRAGIYVDRRVSQTAQIYRNNIIVENEIGLEVDFGSESDNPVWENNLVFDNVINYSGIADQTGVNANIASNPLFIDVMAGDYHLQSGSPAIDAGSEVNAPVIDFDGTTRPIDGNSNGTAETDIGAFEAP